MYDRRSGQWFISLCKSVYDRRSGLFHYVNLCMTDKVVSDLFHYVKQCMTYKVVCGLYHYVNQCTTDEVFSALFPYVNQCMTDEVVSGYFHEINQCMTVWWMMTKWYVAYIMITRAMFGISKISLKYPFDMYDMINNVTSLLFSFVWSSSIFISELWQYRFPTWNWWMDGQILRRLYLQESQVIGYMYIFIYFIIRILRAQLKRLNLIF